MRTSRSALRNCGHSIAPRALTGSATDFRPSRMVWPSRSAHPTAPDVRTRAAYGARPPTAAEPPPGQSNELGKCRPCAHPMVRRCLGLIGVPSLDRPDAHNARAGDSASALRASSSYQEIGRASTNIRIVATSPSPHPLREWTARDRRPGCREMVCADWGSVVPADRLVEHDGRRAVTAIPSRSRNPRAAAGRSE